jgi:hypothetical protein
MNNKSTHNTVEWNEWMIEESLSIWGALFFHWILSSFLVFFYLGFGQLCTCLTDWLSQMCCDPTNLEPTLLNNLQFCTNNKTLFPKPLTKERQRQRQRETESNLPSYHYFQKNLLSQAPTPPPHKVYFRENPKIPLT